MRIVLGLWILQAVSAGLAWLAFSTPGSGQPILWIGLVMGVGLLAALWLSSALRDQQRLGKARASELQANKVAELHAKVAQQRAEDAAKLRALAEKAANSRPSFMKVGFLSGAALGVGVALMMMQLLTVGLVAAAFAGGGIAGYAVRGRLHRRTAIGSGAAISFGDARPGPIKLLSGQSRSLARRLMRANPA